MSFTDRAWPYRVNTAAPRLIGWTPSEHSHDELALSQLQPGPAQFELHTVELEIEIAGPHAYGWLRGERGHCKMVAIPTVQDEDARRPNRERETLVREQSRIINRM